VDSPYATTGSGNLNIASGGILCADSFAYANPGKNCMVVKGTLGVGYPDPSPYTFAVNGSIYALNGYSSSDAWFKTHIHTFDTALDAVLRLRGVTFDWRRDEFQASNFPTGRQIGFLAQEAEQVLPALVCTDREGYKSVAYANMAPVLVEAIKALNSTVEAQQKQIEALKAELQTREQQQARIERLEQPVAELLAASRLKK